MCLFPLKANTTAETTCTEVEGVFDKTVGRPRQDERAVLRHIS